MRAFAPFVLLAVASCERNKDAPPRPSAPAAVDAALPPVVAKHEVPEVRIRADAPTEVHVAWITPPGTAVNDGAPFRVRWNRSDGLADAPRDVKATGSAVKDGFRVEVRPLPKTPNATLAGAIDIVVCDVETHAVCLPVHTALELGFIVVDGASPHAKVEVPLPEAKAR